MMWQNIIVGIIVLAAATVTLVRLSRFFSKPVHKCDGCSGCSIADLKTGIEKKQVS